MHWPKNFVVDITLAIGSLGIVAAFAMGMLIAASGNRESGNAVPVTPTVLANEQGMETPEQEKGTLQPSANQQKTVTPVSTTQPRAQVKTKTEYSTCLVRTQKTLLLNAKGAQFTPWASSTSSREVWDVIRHRYVDYIGGHCLSVTPPPAAYSATCIPRELQSFHRRHIPQGADNENYRAIAAEYALNVCQPSADR